MKFFIEALATFQGFQRWQKHQEQRQRRMELLKLPKNHALYEKHKAMARERTRRYRAKRRQEQVNLESSQSGNVSDVPHSNVLARHPINVSFPFLHYAEVKLEEVSEEENTGAV